MLTAKSDNLSKVRGLRAGADDYLTKPFDVDEFVARVISLIRRFTQFSVIDDTLGKLVYKGLEINLDEHSVTTEKVLLNCQIKNLNFFYTLRAIREKF